MRKRRKQSTTVNVSLDLTVSETLGVRTFSNSNPKLIKTRSSSLCPPLETLALCSFLFSRFAYFVFLFSPFFELFFVDITKRKLRAWLVKEKVQQSALTWARLTRALVCGNTTVSRSSLMIKVTERHRLTLPLPILSV